AQHPGGLGANRSAHGPAAPARQPDWLFGPGLSLVLVAGGAGGPIGNFDMDFDHAREIPRPTEVAPVVEFSGVSKWYGNVIGLNNLPLRIAGGVTGLLGPNGAGKSTLLQLATGQLRPSQGAVRVLAEPVWNNPALNRSIGLCPEQDAFYEWMTGWEFVFT